MPTGATASEPPKLREQINLAIAWLALLTLIFLSGLSFYAWSYQLELLSHFRPQYILVSSLLPLAFWQLKSRWGLGLSLGLLAWGLSVLMPWYLPPAQTPDQPGLKILLANMLFANPESAPLQSPPCTSSTVRRLTSSHFLGAGAALFLESEAPEVWCQEKSSAKAQRRRMMDNNQYSSDAINTSGASYPSASAISPHQLHPQNPSHPSQTLPPLQPNNAAMQSMYGSNPHTPRTPATPSTPASAGNMASYPPTSQPPAGRGTAYHMSTYPPYPTSAAGMPQTTLAPSHQPIAPAPAPGRNAPVLRPMPASGVIPQTGASSPYATGPLMPQPQMQIQESDAMGQVVGPQGRRGVLPSSQGRSQGQMPGTTSPKPMVHVKNEEGKFPCPNCSKTYLHAKHLKRHLLRRELGPL